MDNIIAKLRATGRTATRDNKEVVIITPLTQLDPRTTVESWIPVDDFRAMFPNPGALKSGAQGKGYGKIKEELEASGDL
ncbi:MAG: hypothetical protein HY673_12005 [Chloroflexi bacterium]|nr:hypothetical protein [Chloroflexota bacterium]